MPMKWTEPDAAVTHNGITVYHTYKDGGMKSDYWYTLDMSDDDYEGESAFDIRDLDAFDPDHCHETILRNAIESGELKSDE